MPLMGSTVDKSGAEAGEKISELEDRSTDKIKCKEQKERKEWKRISRTVRRSPGV